MVKKSESTLGWETHLENVYFDAKWPGSFQGVRKVTTQLRQDGYRVNLASIQKWLNKQNSYTLYRRINNKFKRGRVSVHTVNEQLDCDLAFMSGYERENEGYIGFLCTVDVLSRYCRAELIKSKKPAEIVKCLEKILNKNKIQVMRCDHGREFDNSLVRKFLTSKSVKLILTHSDFKANYCEALIKTLKTRLFKLMTHSNSPVWFNRLSDIVLSYNNTVHSAHGFKPVDVNADNAFLVQSLEYMRKSRKSNSKATKFKFSIGDNVRVNYTKDSFHRQYHITYSGEIFTVYKRYRRQGIPVYQLKEWDGSVIEGVFYSEQLLPVTLSTNDTFKIEKILRTRGKGKKREALVKWIIRINIIHGYPSRR